MALECAGCGRAMPDTAYVCSRCCARVARRLAEAGELWTEVDIAVARMARFGEAGPRARHLAPAQPIRPGSNPADDQQPGTPHGLPFDWDASEAVWTVRNTATTWARHIGGERGTTPPEGMVRLLAWLGEQCEWIRHQPIAMEALDELEDVCRVIAAAVDRPANRTRVTVGPCPETDRDGNACGGDVVAVIPAQENRAAYMQCGTCQTQWLTHQWARAGRRIRAVAQAA